jgi:hypothetical protein
MMIGSMAQPIDHYQANVKKIKTIKKYWITFLNIAIQSN